MSSVLAVALAAFLSLQFSACGVGAASSTAASGGGAAQLSANPSPVAFGAVTVGTTSTKSVTLSNVGGATTTVASVSFSGAGFSVSGISTPVNIASGQSVNFSVGFAPGGAGTSNGSISFKDTAGVTLLSLPLSAAGTTGTAQLIATPSPVAFGSVVVNSTNSKTVSLSNSGTGTASVSSFAVSGTGFSVSGIGSPFDLAPGASVGFSVGFAPASTGAATGTVLLKNSTGGTLLSIPLTANAVTASSHSVTLSWVPSSSNVVGYHVYRASLSGGPYGIVSAGLVTTPNYVDTNLISGNSYFYVVTAVDSANAESGFSNEAVAIIPIP